MGRKQCVQCSAADVSCCRYAETAYDARDAQFHGIIRNGGEAPNIVPEKVTAELYIRALDKKYLQDLIQKVDNCAEGACIATGTNMVQVSDGENL